MKSLIRTTALTLSLTAAAEAQEHLLEAPPGAAPVRRPVEVAPAAAVAEEDTLRVYDFGAFVGTAGIETTQAELRKPGLSSDEARERVAELERQVANLERTMGDLLTTVEELIEPPLVEDVHRLARMSDGELLLVGTARQHAWLEELHGAVEEASSSRSIFLSEVEIYRFDPNEVRVPAGTVHGAMLDPERRQGVRDSLSASRAELTMAPKLALYPLQSAELSVLEQVAYVRDFDVQRIDDPPAVIADPIIDTVQDGLMLGLRCLPWREQRVLVAADVTYSDLQRPIQSFTTTLEGVGGEVTVQLPTVVRVELGARLDLKEGETMVLRRGLSADEELLILLSVDRRSEAELEAEAEAHERR